jgi:glutathione S-transferase
MFKQFNELLLQESSSGPYFLGDQYSLADIAITPFALRLYASVRFISDDFEFEQVEANPRLAEFFKGIMSRPSAQETYCGDKVFIEGLQQMFGLTKQ